MKNDKNELENKELEAVNGGTAPELRPQTLEPDAYKGMFEVPEPSKQYDIHFYKEGSANSSTDNK